MNADDAEQHTTLEDSFAEFADSVLGLPWGSLSKGELEFQVFRLLVAEGRIGLHDKSDTALASDLAITPARVRSLRFKWEQRENSDLTIEQMLERVIPHALTPQGDELIIRVDSGYVLDRLVDELRSGPDPVLVRTLRTPGHVQVDVIGFWVKANSLCGQPERETRKLLAKLEQAFPERALTKASEKRKAFVTKLAALSGIGSFLNDAIAVPTP